MNIIKDNPPLSLNAVTEVCDGQNTDFIVSPSCEKIAQEIIFALLMKFAEKNNIRFLEASKVFGATEIIRRNLKNDEWLLITPKNKIYYSNGNNTI